MKINTIRTADVSPTNLSMSLKERKAVEEFIKVSSDAPQDMIPWVSGYGIKKEKKDLIEI